MIPIQLKKALGKLIHANPEEIILGNSTSYGIHLLVIGIPWEKGDEILLVQNDYPADILPWLGLEKYNVRIRFINPKDSIPTSDEVQNHSTLKIRVFCWSWVNSFNGHAIDIHSIGKNLS